MKRYCFSVRRNRKSHTLYCGVCQREFFCSIIFYTETYFASEKYAKMVELIKSFGEEYGFYILDLWNSDEMRAVFGEDYERYMSDPVHPTPEGTESGGCLSLWKCVKIYNKNGMKRRGPSLYTVVFYI